MGDRPNGMIRPDDVPSPRPALVGISHGTSSPHGQRAIARLMDVVASVDAAILVRSGFVDMQRPTIPETLASVPEESRSVVVPLLLSAGYHVHVDLTEATRDLAPRVVLADALGPDPRLITILRRRLRDAGCGPDDVVILAAAGSSDRRALGDCRRVRNGLADELGREVHAAFLSAAEPSLSDAINRVRDTQPGRRIVVSSYLLAPGYFQSLIERSNADAVTAPLLTADGPIPAGLVDLIHDRYHAAIARP
ncbi:sirohydrochlorin chelatase [Lacisediminihabitans sp.]|uniref:sirohydrochlorin chelatase n=1 Tax=Lacisediminihabitans sp. TaxID=2787631 RepID=UPI002F943503